MARKMSLKEFAKWINSYKRASDVARILRANQIGGCRRYDPRRCPLAYLAQKKTGRPIAVTAYFETDDAVAERAVKVKNGARKFMTRFDLDEYPEFA